MGLLNIFLYSLLPLFVVGNIFRLEIREGIFVNLLDLGIIALLPISVYYLTLNKNALRKNPFFKYLTVFLAAILLSLLVNIFTLDSKTALIAILYFLRLFAFFQLIFIFSLLTKNFRKRFLNFLSFSIGLTAILGLMQYFLYDNLRNLEYLGWDVHQYRVFSTFLDPNFAGVIFLMGLFIIISNLKKYSSKMKKTSFVLFFIEAIAVFLTYSRTAYVTLLVTSSIYISKFRKIYIIIPLSFLIFGVLLLPKDLKSEGVNLARTASIQARIQENSEGINVFFEHPIFGIGYNAYRAYNPRAESKFPENAASGIPNSYILTLSTTGVIGFVALIYLCIGVYKFISKIKSPEDKTLITTLSLILLSSALFENTMYYNYIIFVYFSALGIVSAKENS